MGDESVVGVWVSETLTQPYDEAMSGNPTHPALPLSPLFHPRWELQIRTYERVRDTERDGQPNRRGGMKHTLTQHPVVTHLIH
jgi:hypothetical protein